MLTLQPACLLCLRHRPLHLSLSEGFRFVRYFASEEPRNAKAQRSATRAFTRAHLSSYVAGLAILIGARLYYKKHRNDGEQHEERLETYTNPHFDGSGSIVKMGSFWVPKEFLKDKQQLQNVKDFGLRDDDVFVVSFPKSGTTWVQAIVHMLMKGELSGESDSSTIEDRFPYLEYVYPGLAALRKRPSPRLIKSHLPYEMLPDDIERGKAKVIYVARNAKDTMVSYYYFVKMLSVTKYTGLFEDFYHSFMTGKVPYGPWSEHVLQYWRRREDSNVLFITYEDLHTATDAVTIPAHRNGVGYLQDCPAVVRAVARFLGLPVSDSQVGHVVAACSFDRMRRDPTTNYSWWEDLGIRTKGSDIHFMRKGIIGDWRRNLSGDMSAEVDDMCARRLTPVGLHFREYYNFDEAS